MKIETKFDVGDEVWFNCKQLGILRVKIKAWMMTFGENTLFEECKIYSPAGEGWCFAFELYVTRAEIEAAAKEKDVHNNAEIARVVRGKV